jgi:hypothetical protein
MKKQSFLELLFITGLAHRVNIKIFSARSADALFQGISMSSSAIPLFRCGELLPCGSIFKVTNRKEECQSSVSFSFWRFNFY